MTPALHRRYRPITASPLLRGPAYAEVSPGAALAPYVRCFWGTSPAAGGEISASPALVIPDTCMDVIFRARGGLVCGSFCAMDEYAQGAPQPLAEEETVFAVRFYPWAAALFADAPLSGSANGRFDSEAFFPSLAGDLSPLLLRRIALRERARLAEPLLLRRLREDRLDPLLFNAIDAIVRSRGAARVGDLCAGLAVSPRRLQRRFESLVGLPPKTFAVLVRYQLLWQDLCRGERDTLDLAFKYGYCDQAHLLDDFRHRHGMTPAQALRRSGF